MISPALNEDKQHILILLEWRKKRDTQREAVAEENGKNIFKDGCQAKKRPAEHPDVSIQYIPESLKTEI